MHGVDGISFTAMNVGDRLELLTGETHWQINKLSATHYWLSIVKGIEGPSRITPIGTMVDEVLSTDWVQEGGHFHFVNHRTEQNESLGPIVLLAWTKNYTLIEEPADA